MIPRPLNRCLLAFAVILGRYACADVNDLAKEVKTTGAAIEADLDTFKQDGKTELLGEAQRLIAQLSQSWQQDPDLIRTQVLRFRLQLLQVCFESQDRACDLNNPPQVYVNVTPPIFTPGMMSGMDPACIQDPVARKAYEEAIAENKRREEKYAREKILREFIDGGLRDTKRHLNWSRDLGTLKSDAKIIKGTITNADLMKKLKEEVLLNFYDEKGLPLSK